jgi:ribosome-associated protein
MKPNLSIREQALRPESKPMGRPLDTPSGDPEAHENEAGQTAELDARIRTAISAAGEKKSLEVTLLDLREVATFTDYFLITSGKNVRQVQAIADEIVDQLKKQGTRAARVEGYQTAEWVLVDYGDFVVHVFDDKARKFYDLERLWREARRVELPPEAESRGENTFLRNESQEESPAKPQGTPAITSPGTPPGIPPGIPEDES